MPALSLFLLVASAQTFSLALGPPSAEVDWRRHVSDRFALGARAGWDQLDRDESLSISALGIAVPLSFEVALGSLNLSLEAAPGARRLTSRYRDAANAVVDAAPVYSLQLPLTGALRIPFSGGARLMPFATLAPDFIFSGGIALSPQAGLAVETDLSSAFSIGLEARAGRVFVLEGEPPIFAGRHAVTMPLAIMLTAALRLTPGP